MEQGTHAYIKQASALMARAFFDDTLYRYLIPDEARLNTI
jgi:hypothetical protein